jgi:AraC-like DNA-binding protein
MRIAVFQSMSDPHIILPTLRPLIGSAYSLELQETPPALLNLPVRQWHVVTLLLSRSAAVRRLATSHGSEFRLSNGDAGIHPAGRGEAIHWPEGFHGIHLHIHPDTLVRDAGRPQKLLLRPRVSDRFLRESITSLLVHGAAQRGATAESDATVHAICRHLLRQYCEDDVIPPGPLLGVRKLSDVQRQISANTGSILTVQQLAASCMLSRSHFSRAFARLTGMAPQHYQLRVRLERAKHLLAATDCSPVDVAYACGFADQSHLGRLLRRFAGASPREYQAFAARSLQSWR